MEPRRKSQITLPEDLLIALKTECARRRVPLQYAMIWGAEEFLRHSVVFRKFLEKEVKEHPAVARARGQTYYKGNKHIQEELEAEERIP